MATATSRQRAVIGIDLGTSAVKATLVDETGNECAAVVKGVTLQTPKPGWSEQQPEEWVKAAFAALSELVTGSRDAFEIAAVAVSGQMHGAVLLDHAGVPLRPAILWNDQRSAAECAEITEAVGFDRLIELVGNRALAGFTAPKVLWVRTHEPDVFARISTVLLPKDYLNYRMTGVLATEPSDASGTLLFDVKNGRWSAELLDALGLSPNILPDVIPSEAIVGTVTEETVQATGLARGTPVVAGGADNACAALGLGVIDTRDILVSIGTSGTVVASSPNPHIDPAGRLHTFSHVTPDRWYSMGVVLSAGASLRWFRDTIWHGGASADDDYDRITESAALSPLGSEGLFFLPYLAGERTPHGDPHARGTYIGLSLRHTRSHLARATFEGITFALRDCLAVLQECGIEPAAIRLTGGGANSPFWTQMVADVFGLPVKTSARQMGPSFGAAILAGSAVAMFSSSGSSVDTMVRLSEPVLPRAEATERYARQFEIYRELYPALAPMFRRISSDDR